MQRGTCTHSPSPHTAFDSAAATATASDHRSAARQPAQMVKGEEGSRWPGESSSSSTYRHRRRIVVDAQPGQLQSSNSAINSTRANVAKWLCLCWMYWMYCIWMHNITVHHHHCFAAVSWFGSIQNTLNCVQCVSDVTCSR